MTSPYSFDEFFASNQEESISPFLTPDSRLWGRNLPLKSSLLAALLLALAYFLSFTSPIYSALSLSTVYLLVGTPALIGSLKDLSRWDINIDVLMTLAALLSVVIGSGLEGALLLVLFELSAGIEQMVSKKTKSSVLHLNRLSPRHAFCIENSHLIEKAIRDIDVGSFILVKAGEIIPLDGVITEGRSFVNLLYLTGESAPVSKDIGDEVPAGGTTLDGSLTLRVTKNSRDSTLNRIIQLITEAQETKPLVEQFLDRFGRVYATSIISLFILFALLLPPLISLPYLGPTGGIYRALAFLIAASPCALILATPTAYLSALSSCARKGVLPKGGIVLDAINRCRTVALDKTGTLTTGELSCISQSQIAGPPLDPIQALSYAASLERHATHPIAKALVSFAASKNAPLLSPQNLHSISGLGLEATIDTHSTAIGHHDFIQQKTSFTLPSAQKISTYLQIGTSIFLFEFEDTLRSNAKETIAQLQKENLKTVMLTGDHRINAEPIAIATGIDESYADLKPEDKLQKIKDLTAQTDLMMVGDGINDAPALTRATVGVSMGTIGSATAVDASDVILIHDDLSLLPWLIKKARHTRRILTQNITLALIVILFATTPALLGFIPLWLAVILHEGGTVLVGLNSLRLLRK
jgi:heavy metal translocating P-type ATPase